MSFSKPLLAIFSLIPLYGQAQMYLYSPSYYSNQLSAYSIDPQTGTLTPLSGFPLAVGPQPGWITIDPFNRFAYVTNNGGNNISGFAISSSGGLTPLPGSPYPAGNAPYGAGVDPQGKFLYANNQLDSSLSGYSLDQQSGALTPVAGSPFQAGPRPLYNVAFHPNARFVYTTSLNGNAVSGFSIDSATGTLTALSGSPFTVASGPVALAIDPLGRYLYVTLANGQAVYGFAIDPYSGSLTPVPGSPFGVGRPVVWMAIEASSRFLYAVNPTSFTQGSVTALAIDQTTGALVAIAGSPFPAGVSPASITSDPSGNFLYVGNGTGDISAYTIDQVEGSLSPVAGSPFHSDGPSAWLAIATPRPATGTINVTTNLTAATFTITGPAVYQGSGVSYTQGNAPGGVYTITYNQSNCYTTPASESQTLQPGGSLTFTGTFEFECGLSVSSATVFVGLRNSDDQGTRFDVRIELLKNGALIATGQVNCVSALTTTPKAVTVPLGALVDGAPASQFTLSFRVLARIGTNPDGSKCTGHNNATGLRLSYDSTSRPSRFGLQFGTGSLTDMYLHTLGGVDTFTSNSPGSSTSMFKDSAGLDFAGSNPFRQVGVWTATLP